LIGSNGINFVVLNGLNMYLHAYIGSGQIWSEFGRKTHIFEFLLYYVLCYISHAQRQTCSMQSSDMHLPGK